MERAKSFQDAKKLNQAAANDLAGVAQAKRAAATQDPGADTFAATAKSARTRREGPWSQNSFDVLAGTRTTS
jgi:hypothetical protein